MELEQVIKDRFSCRSYLPNPISDETIRKIVESARIAPSSKNAQQWKFVCIKTENESKDIALILENFYIKKKEAGELSKGMGSMFSTGKILEQCPAIILVFEDCERIDRTKQEDISALLSIGCAVEHMVLTATDLGLGSLWVCDTSFVHCEIADYILNKLKDTKYKDFISYDNRLVCALAIGECAEDKHTRPRKELADILCIINN